MQQNHSTSSQFCENKFLQISQFCEKADETMVKVVSSVKIISVFPNNI